MEIHRVQDFVVEGKEVFIGLEDSKKTWKIAVRCDRMVIHQVSRGGKVCLAEAIPEKPVYPVARSI